MTDTFHANIAGVYAEDLGSQITVAASIADTVLQVASVVDFDDDGGFLVLNDVVLEYETRDSDDNTLTLTVPLAAAAAVDDRVDVWDVANSQNATIYKAVFDQIDGFDGEPGVAVVSQANAHALSQTMRDGTGESVTLSREDSELQVAAIHGRNLALAVLQYLQGGMTTRTADNQPGIDILGVDAGIPGFYIYDADGNVAMEITADLAGGIFQFWTGAATEIGPGYINPATFGSSPYLVIASPETSLGQTLVSLADGLFSVTATASQFTGDLEVDGNLTVPVGDVSAGQHLVTGNPPGTTNAVNCRIGSAGVLNIVTSLTKHKHDPQPVDAARLQQLLDVPLVDWVDAGQKDRNKGMVNGLRRIPGVLAEDVQAADPDFADYDDKGELAGVMYDRLALGQIQALLTRVVELEKLVADLTSKDR